MTPAGVFTDLHDFDPNTEGGQPFSALIEGTNGFLYGTTAYGGTYNSGPLTPFLREVETLNPVQLRWYDGYIPGCAAGAAYGRNFYSDSAWAAAMISGPSTHSAPAYRRSSGLLPPLQKLGRPSNFLARDSLARLPFLSMAHRRLSTIASKTYLTAIVPIGATSGFIKVTNEAELLKVIRRSG